MHYYHSFNLIKENMKLQHKRSIKTDTDIKHVPRKLEEVTLEGNVLLGVHFLCHSDHLTLYSFKMQSKMKVIFSGSPLWYLLSKNMVLHWHLMNMSFWEFSNFCNKSQHALNIMLSTFPTKVLTIKYNSLNKT